jgi:hypothetical protein
MVPSIPISQHSRLNLFGAFPIARAQTPRLPPSHVSQRGPTSHQAEKSRSGPHRKTLNKAALMSDVYEADFRYKMTTAD